MKAEEKTAVEAGLKTGLEIERKYLIRMPNVEMLSGLPDCEIWNILQIYLRRDADESSRRVRRVLVNGETHYYFTVKQRVSALSCRESEGEISPEEYAALAAQADPELRPIEKRRLRIPYRNQLLEVDLYTFWQDRATLEIEMQSEDQTVELPDWLEVVREVTGERAYKNLYLAQKVPMEDIGRKAECEIKR